MRKSTRIAEGVQYLGGLHDAHPATGNLMADDECLGIGRSKPKEEVVRWEDMASVSLDSGSMKRSRSSEYLKAGVIGALAPRTDVSADLTVRLRAGGVVRYRILGLSGRAVAVALQPFMIAHGVPLLAEQEGTNGA